MICTPNAGNANNVRNVNSDGSLNWNNAYNGNNGVRPDLVKTRPSKATNLKTEYPNKGDHILPDAGKARVNT